MQLSGAGASPNIPSLPSTPLCSPALPFRARTTIFMCKQLKTKKLFPLLWVLPALLFAACPASSEDVRPPDDQFFFPTGMAMDSAEANLFITNANSDLRYDSGSISVVDLARVSEIAAGWIDGGQLPQGRDCEADRSVPHTLLCNEEEVIRADATVRTGNFATEIATQELDDGRTRLFAAVRGDPSLTWIDYDPSSQTLDCGGGGALPRCDEDHRLSRMRNDQSVGNIPAEPFGIYVDGDAGFAVLTHLTQAAVTLANAPRDGSAPILSDALGGVFEASPLTGARSALGVSGRNSGGRVYVTSRSDSRVQIFTVARIANQLPALVPAEFFFLRGVQPSDDGRGIQFSESGNRAYVLNRTPAMLQVIDTSLNEVGLPKNDLDSAIEVCSNSSNLQVGDLGAGNRAYVTCFRDGQVWVVNTATRSIESIIDVGRGPQSIELSTTRKQLYVTNFLEDTVSVIDLTPGAKTENRVVLKLGRTRQSGGK